MLKLRRLFAIEIVAAVSGTLMTVGLPFFTHHRFGWGARQNLLLAAAQGVVYVTGALMAQSLARRWGRRSALAGLYVLLTLIGAGLAAAGALDLQTLFVALVLIEMMVIAMTWPMVESLVSTGAADASELSGRLAQYNINWALTGAITLAACGAILERAAPWTFFAIGAAGHLASLFLLLTGGGRAPAPASTPATASTAAASAAASPSAMDAVKTADAGTYRKVAEGAKAAASPDGAAIGLELISQRRLALWLSRIALPATYVVAYSLAPLLPSLPAVSKLAPSVATLLASVWLAARALLFFISSRTKFWHSRPDLMLWSAIVMLVAFVSTVVPPALDGLSLTSAIVIMIAAQVLLGMSLGMIYASSLYFGMVLSKGSTEHGSYHEALIGLGQTLGPGVGALVLWMRPGDFFVGIAAVSTMVVASIVIAAVARLRLGRHHGQAHSAPTAL